MATVQLLHWFFRGQNFSLVLFPTFKTVSSFLCRPLTHPRSLRCVLSFQNVTPRQTVPLSKNRKLFCQGADLEAVCIFRHSVSGSACNNTELLWDLCRAELSPPRQPHPLVHWSVFYQGVSRDSFYILIGLLSLSVIRKRPVNLPFRSKQGGTVKNQVAEEICLWTHRWEICRSASKAKVFCASLIIRSEVIHFHLSTSIIVGLFCFVFSSSRECFVYFFKLKKKNGTRRSKPKNI